MEFAERVKFMKASEIRELLKVTEKKDIISFGGGMPGTDSFPVSEIRKIIKKILNERWESALQYGTTEGFIELRKELTKMMRKIGIRCGINEIIITTGSQQALDLIGKIFINPGDIIAVELPTYIGAICAFNSYQPRYLGVPMDDEGILTEYLEKKIKEEKAKGRKIKFIYTIPNFQNPTGITMSHERRKHLLEISYENEIPIIEDDAYRFLYYSKKPLYPIKSMDKLGLVTYTSTFSKILSPALRLGWVVGREDIIDKIVLAKQGADLCSNAFSQQIAYEYIRSGAIEKQVEKIRRIYKRKRDLMIDSIKKYFPEGTNYTIPEGGLFVWVELPKNLRINTSEIFERAIKEKVAFVHGSAFFVERKNNRTMRLNFSNMSEEKIIEGIRRLALVIREVKNNFNSKD
ncbi:MAG: PLP-dependent aminotransferase family protein [Candidatus Aenigmatarchaeota archaeon]